MKKGILLGVAVILVLTFALASRPEPTYQKPQQEAFSPPEKVKLVTVEKGDTLSLYASRFSEKKYTWQYIARLNNEEYPFLEKNPALLRPGQIIKVPARPDNNE